MVRSSGMRSWSARSTVSPPTPESKTPIGRSSLNGLPGRQPVPHTWDGLQHDPGVAGSVELPPQALDVRVDRVVVDVSQITPDLLQQLRAGENPAGVGREEGKQVELGHRQSHFM